jgi:drug/metabolite transporter (DMT)-like permease
MTRLRADLLLLACAAIWGSGFILQKEAMVHIGALTFIASRTALAVVVLAPLALRERRRSGGTFPAGLVKVSLMGGIAFFVAAWLQQEGLKTASVTNTGFLTGLYVVFTPIAAWLIFLKRPAALVLPAVALSFVGTWLLGGGTASGFGLGDALVAVSAVFWALHVLVTGEASGFNHPATFTCLQFAIVSALAAVGAAFLETPTIAGLAASAVPIAYIGILSSALTFTVLTHAMRATPPTEAAILVSAESLFAAAAGAILLGERLSAVSWLGAALITASVLLVQFAPRPASEAKAG